MERPKQTDRKGKSAAGETKPGEEDKPPRAYKLTGEHKRSIPKARRTKANLTRALPETTSQLPPPPEKRRGNLILHGSTRNLKTPA